MADLGRTATGENTAPPAGYEWVWENGQRVLRQKPTVTNPITGATEYAPAGYSPPPDSTGAVNTTGPAIGGAPGGSSYGGAGSMDSLLSPADQIRADAAAQLAQRNTEAERLAASTTEANRLQQAEADRLSREGLSAAEIAARMAELKTGASLADQNAAATTGRNAYQRTQLMGQIPGFLASITGDGAGPLGGGGADPSAANAATFKAAGDKVGAIGRGSVDALHDASSERGGFGAGVEAGSIAALRGGNAARAADVGRQQTISAVDTQNQMANRNYAGALTKRGQDLGVTQSMLSLLGPRAY